MRVLSLMWGVPYGGIGRCVYAYDRLNQQAGLQVSTACIVTDAVQRKYADARYRAQEDLHATIVNVRGCLDTSWRAAVRRLVRDSKPDVLFVHGFNGAIVAHACQRACDRDVLLVCSYHGVYHPPTWSKFLLAPVYNRSMLHIYKRHATRVVAVCSYSRDCLLQHGVPETKISVIHNGIPDTRDQRNCPTRHELGLAKNDFVFGAVSCLDPVKGLIHLIDAFAGVFRAFSQARLVVIGDGPQADRLKARSKELGIATAVSFMGYQPNADAWLSAFDAFVLPSLHECHSISLLEAMRAGLPIVATNVGGNTESVRHEMEGLIVPPANAETLQAALSRMINEPALRDRLSMAARKRFEAEFTEDVMLRKMATWFKSLEGSIL